MQLLNDHLITAFKQNNTIQFRDKMIHYLRNAYPDETLALHDEPLQHNVQTGIMNAAQYGITKKQDIRRYLEYSLSYSWDFDSNTTTPWITDLLTTPLIDGRAKMDKLERADGQPF